MKGFKTRVGSSGTLCAFLLLTCLLGATSAGAQVPVAAFSGSRLVGAPPLAVSFTDQSTNSPTSWLWVFGDGYGSTSQNPAHTYASNGSYTVSLTAVNASGQDTETKLDFVVVTTNRIVNVSTSSTLQQACWNAQDGDVILVANGTYSPVANPFCRLENKSNILLRGASGDASAVILQGYGWDSTVTNDDILWIWGSSNISVGYLTFREARYYGIKCENSLLNGRGLENISIYQCNFQNLGMRMIKGTGADFLPVQTGSIRSCRFENTKIPPSNWDDGGNYIAAIDMMCLHGWTIADNTFKNIKGYSGGGRGAIFIWVESQDVISERNTFAGCDRSIAYGNPYAGGDQTLPHMTNGVIRNNFVVTGASKGIELCWVNGVQVYQNTVLTPSESGPGINYLWGSLLGIHIANNLVRGLIWGDTGAEVTLEGNLQTGILDSWFTSVTSGDLHLTSLAAPAIDEVTALTEAPTDFDQQSRPTTPGLTDIGADEYAAAAAPPVANFSGNPTSGVTPLLVMFTDLSSNSPTSWSWSFGDGGSSAAQNPSHSYTSAGQYTVALTASNSYGSDTETKAGYISAVQPQDYFCSSLTVNNGSILSGSHTSVHASDDIYLVLKSAKSSGKQVTQVTYTFTTGLSSLSSLSLTVEGKVSAGTQPQTVYVYNYATSTWETKETSTLTTSDTTASVSLTSPGNYLSGGTVQVRVKTGGSGSTVYNHSTDLVKITAAP